MNDRAKADEAAEYASALAEHEYHERREHDLDTAAAFLLREEGMVGTLRRLAMHAESASIQTRSLPPEEEPF